MTNSGQVFLDANALVYALDETSEQYAEAVRHIQQLLYNNVTICTSHHVIEEVLHIARKIASISATDVIKEVSKIPNLVLVEPDTTLEFAERYAKLSDTLKIGVNDALILQLMLDANIQQLFSYDKKLLKAASSVGISHVY